MIKARASNARLPNSRFATHKVRILRNTVDRCTVFDWHNRSARCPERRAPFIHDLTAGLATGLAVCALAQFALHQDRVQPTAMLETH
jgi:hypothetical protein